MNTISTQLTPTLEKVIKETFNASVSSFEFQATRKEFEGDITLVVFGLLRVLKGNPVQNRRNYRKGVRRTTSMGNGLQCCKRIFEY